MLTKRDKKYIEDEVEKIGKYLVDTTGPGMSKFSEITPHIFISNWASSCLGTYLKDKSIEFVICVSKDKKNRDEMKLYDAMRIHQIYIPLDDDMRENINVYFERFYETMYAAILEEKNVFFVGRLANYKYYNMDAAILAALESADKYLSFNS
jgi:hypothetical protein